MDIPFRKQYTLDGDPKDIWEAFLDEDKIENWLASESEMGETIGRDFYWKVDGRRMDVRVVVLAHLKRIVLDWRRETWAEGHFARVILAFSSATSPTYLEVKVTKIPDSENFEVSKDWENIMKKLGEYLKKK